eukprot:SAG22_NODE_9044_length_613_cov_0.939689_2_plen_80_part_00
MSASSTTGDEELSVLDAGSFRAQSLVALEARAESQLDAAFDLSSDSMLGDIYNMLPELGGGTGSRSGWWASKVCGKPRM